MPNILRTSMIALVTMLLASVFGHTVHADVRLELTDGRTIRGDRLVAADSGDHVDLRIERPGMRLTRHLPWSDIVSGEVDGVAVDAATLRERFGHGPRATTPTITVASATDVVPVPAAPVKPQPIPMSSPPPSPCDVGCVPFVPMWLAPPLPTRSVILGVRDDPLDAYPDLLDRLYPNGVPANEAGFALQLLRDVRAGQAFGAIPSETETSSPPSGPTMPSPDPFPLPRIPPPPTIIEPSASTIVPRSFGPVASISAGAIPVNRSARATWDALSVDIEARDANGRIVSAVGTLRATLWGQTQELVRSADTHFVAAPRSLVRLANWSQATTTTDGDAAAHVLLPLTQPLPDENLDVAPFGDLHLQWLVPGQGVYETVVTDVPLRRMSATSARSVIDTGFAPLPGVATVRGRQRAGLGFFSPTTVVPNGRVLSVQP